MSATITLDLETFVDLFLGYRPYGFISDKSSLYHSILSIPAEDRAGMVVENEAWTIGFNNEPMPACAAGIYRLWRRKDWELCDNKRKEAVTRIDAAQEQYRLQRLAKLEAVKKDLANKGVTEAVWLMLSTSMDDTTLNTMFNNIKKG